MAEEKVGRDCAANLILIAVTVMVSVCVIEIVLAFFMPQPVLRNLLADTPAMHVEGDVLPHPLRQNYQGRFRRPEFDTSIKINSEGFRGHEFRSKGEPRMIIIGDSFTFGHGVDDSDAYPSLMDALLTHIEVVNGGFVAGSSPGMYLAWLRAYGSDIKAAGYLIGFFIGNDIDRNEQMVWAEVDVNGLPLRIENTESHVVDNYLRPRVTSIGYRYPILRESHLFHVIGSVYRNVESLLSPQLSGASIYDEHYLPETAEHIKRTKSVFYAISKWMKEHRKPFAVVMIPTMQQVLDDANDKPQNEFARYFEEIGVRYLDLLPEMKLEEKSLYYPVDQHWNPRGNEVAAQLIASWLSDAPLIDDRLIEPLKN